jgi:hypothetical protein
LAFFVIVALPLTQIIAGIIITVTQDNAQGICGNIWEYSVLAIVLTFILMVISFSYFSGECGSGSCNIKYGFSTSTTFEKIKLAVTLVCYMTMIIWGTIIWYDLTDDCQDYYNIYHYPLLMYYFAMYWTSVCIVSLMLISYFGLICITMIDRW